MFGMDSDEHFQCTLEGIGDIEFGNMVRLEWKRRWELREPYHFRVHNPGDEEPWAQCLEWKGCIVHAQTMEELNKILSSRLNFYRLEADRKNTLVKPNSKLMGKDIVEVKLLPIEVAFLEYDELKEFYEFAEAKMTQEPTMDSRRELMEQAPSIIKRLTVCYLELSRAYREFVGGINE